MAVVGFNFTKITCEKKKQATGKVDISNKLRITDVKDTKIGGGKAKQPAATFLFTYSTEYNPKVGKIELEGAAIFMEKEDKIKDVLDQWDKKKAVPNDVMEKVYNSILAKCNVESIVLSRDIGLPPNIPLPKLKTNAKA